MLDVRELRVSYEEPVLQGLNIAVGAGEIVCILGPSGEGKSTLLRAVAGLVAYSGLIEIAGVSIDGVPTHKRGVGMMFQDDLLFGHLDVAGNVGFGLRPADPERVRQMLELVGLPDFGARAVDTLSGGQAQRVALARALAPAPRVLLLDEPFAALDGVLKASVVRDVQAVLRGQGLTVLAVTHDRQEAFTLADRVAILRAGRVVQIATPDQLWVAPADDYVARLVGLSVIDGSAYAPDQLVVQPDGPWAFTVTGRTFTSGAYLVSGTVAGEPVTYMAADVPELGAAIRLAPRS